MWYLKIKLIIVLFLLACLAILWGFSAYKHFLKFFRISLLTFSFFFAFSCYKFSEPLEKESFYWELEVKGGENWGLSSWNFGKIYLYYDALTLYFMLLLELLMVVVFILFFLISIKGKGFSFLGKYSGLMKQRNWQEQEKKNKYFFIFTFIILSLYVFVTLFFLVHELFLFYIFFELSTLPLFFLINFFGKQTRRLKASLYLYFYTFVSSAGFLLAIFYLYSIDMKTYFSHLELYLPYYTSEGERFWLWLAIFIPLMTKLPVIPLHLWLPEAHVEASTEGSVLLAGLLLKLGGYGFLRILLPIFPEVTQFFSSALGVLALISIFYSSLSLFNQVDLKKIVAYFSIVHMNLFLLGIISDSAEGIVGALFLLFSHGLVSSAFFILVGFLYEKFHTRNLFFYVGLANFGPRYVTALFFIFLSNISFPSTSSFSCELLIFLGLVQYNVILTIISILLTFFSSIFMAIIYVRMSFGISKIEQLAKIKLGSKELLFLNRWDLSYSQCFLLIFLLGINMVLGLCPNYYVNILGEVYHHLAIFQPFN